MILYDYMKKRNGVGRTGAVKWALSKEEFDLLGIDSKRMIPPLTLAEICVVITFGWLPILVYAITFGRDNIK